jgi:phage replication initiation protein
MHIDYLSFTFKRYIEDVAKDDLDFSSDPIPFDILVNTILEPCFNGVLLFRRRKNGLYNYSVSYDICIDITTKDFRNLVEIGILAFGGNSESCYVQLSGTACSLCDFTILHSYIKDLYMVKITRLDIAEDFLNVLSNKFNFDFFIDAYKLESFKSKMSRVNPKNLLIGDFLSEDSPNGRTLYVGDRKSPKFCRIYEKGKQSKSQNYPNWIRFEIEFKAADKNVILIDSIINYRDLFLNAYPVCMDLDLGDSTTDLRIERKKVQVIDGIDLQIKNVKKQYGQFLHYLVNYTDKDINEVLRPGINKKCKEFLLFPQKVFDNQP